MRTKSLTFVVILFCALASVAGKFGGGRGGGGGRSHSSGRSSGGHTSISRGSGSSGGFFSNWFGSKTKSSPPSTSHSAPSASHTSHQQQSHFNVGSHNSAHNQNQHGSHSNAPSAPALSHAHSPTVRPIGWNVHSTNTGTGAHASQSLIVSATLLRSVSKINNFIDKNCFIAISVRNILGMGNRAHLVMLERQRKNHHQHLLIIRKIMVALAVPIIRASNITQLSTVRMVQRSSHISRTSSTISSQIITKHITSIRVLLILVSVLV